VSLRNAYTSLSENDTCRQKAITPRLSFFVLPGLRNARAEKFLLRYILSLLSFFLIVRITVYNDKEIGDGQKLAE